MTKGKLFIYSVVLVLIVIICSRFGMFSNEKKLQQQIIHINGYAMTVDQAVTEDQQRQGLSGRKSLNENQGMLFIFPYEQSLAFWMKDMLLPIDIIWLDSNCRIVYIAANQQPCKSVATCPSVQPQQPAQFVLETVAFFAQQHDLQLGDRVIVAKQCQ